jgi:hypothetical protein
MMGRHGNVRRSEWLDRHLHLHFSVQTVQNRYQPVNGETAEARAPYPGKVRRRNAGQACRLPYGQLLFIEGADNLGGQNGAQLFRIGMRVAHVTKDVATATHQFKIVVAHDKNSLNRLNRTRTTSISSRGVAMPVLDFF